MHITKFKSKKNYIFLKFTKVFFIFVFIIFVFLTPMLNSAKNNGVELQQANSYNTNYDFSDPNPITNFKYNALYNHEAKFNEWKKSATNLQKIYAKNDSLRVDTTTLKNFNGTNPLQKVDLTFNIDCQARSFVNPNSYLTIEQANIDNKLENLIKNQSDEINSQKKSVNKFISSFKQQEQCRTMHHWKQFENCDWRSSNDYWGFGNCNDPALAISSYPQNWEYVYENLIKISSLGSPFSDVDVSFFEDFISSNWTSNNSLVNCFKGFISNNNLIDSWNGDFFKLNNFDDLSQEFKNEKLGSVASATVWHNLTSTWVTLFDFIEFTNQLDIKAINYDLNNLIAIDDYGMEINESNTSFRYYFTLGLNEDYIEASQILYQNQDLYDQYKNGLTEKQKEEWMDSQFIFQQNNWHEYRDKAIDHIIELIIKPEDFISINNKKSYDDKTDIISINNIDQIKKDINAKTKEKKQVLTNFEIDEIVNNNRNDKWAKNCLKYNIQTKDVYDNLIIVLPYLNYTSWLEIGNDSENPTNFSKSTIDCNPECGYFNFDQLINGQKIYLSNNTIENNRSFKVNIDIKNSYQKNTIKIDEFETTTNIEKVNSQWCNDQIKLIELRKEQGEQSESYWYMPKNSITIVDYTKKDNIKNVDLKIFEKYSKLTPSDAFRSTSNDQTEFSNQNRLKEIFYNANCSENFIQNICPIEMFDLYNNKINIKNNYLKIAFNDQKGEMIIIPYDISNKPITNKTINIFGFRAIDEIEINFGFEEIIVALDQPKSILNTIYIVDVINPPKDSLFKVYSLDAEILNVTYQQKKYDSKMTCEFKIIPLKTGITKINFQLIAADNSQIYATRETENIYVDEVFVPKIMPTIYQKNWEKIVLPISGKNQGNKIYEFGIKNNIEGTTADFTFDKNNCLNIYYLNNEHTKFKLEAKCDKPQNITMKIKLKNGESDSKVEYSTSKFQISIVRDENKKLSPAIWSLIVIGAIFLIAIIISIILWIIRKKKA